MVCAGDDPTLVKALVLKQFFSGQGPYVYMSFHVCIALNCIYLKFVTLLVSRNSFRMAVVYVYVSFICKICFKDLLLKKLKVLPLFINYP